MANGYDIMLTATIKGKRICSINWLSQTGLFGDDYMKALRMLEAGMSFTFNSSIGTMLLKPVA